MKNVRLDSIILAVVVVSALALSAAICAPQTEYAKGAGTILHFPKDRSVGHLLLFNTRHDVAPLKVFCAARGDVEVPPKTNLGLKLSYAAIQDMTFLKNLDPSCLMLLDASRLDIDDDRAFNVHYLTGLRTLNLNNTEIGDKGLQYVSNLKQLIRLDLGDTGVTGRGLVHLYGLQLEDLSLMHDRVGDDELASLEGMQHLRVLRLIGSGIGDKAMVHLAKMRGLFMLRLSSNRGITDAGISHLLPLVNLDSLDLSETSVTPACAKYLKALPKLKSLSISFHKYSPTEIAAFKASLPHVAVVDRMPVTHETTELFAPLHSPIAPQHDPSY